MVGTVMSRTEENAVHCPCWETVGSREAGPELGGSVLSLKGVLRVTPEASLCFVLSGSALLLLLQTDGRETRRSTLLPGLFMATQGVHASPEVTASGHTAGCLSFLTEALQGGLALCTRK